MADEGATRKTTVGQAEWWGISPHRGEYPQATNVVIAKLSMSEPLVLFLHVCTCAGRATADKQASWHRRNCSKTLETLGKKNPTGVDLKAPNP